MTLQLQRETHEILYVGLTGTIPSVGAEAAILPPGERPEESDWVEAILVDSPLHELWNDATASGASGNYFVAVSAVDNGFGPPDIQLTPGQYQFWIRLTDAAERPIRVAPEVVRVL